MDGRVRSWGMVECGGDCSAVEHQLEDVEQIVGSLGAFAAIKTDQTVITWGHPDSGGDSSLVQEKLKNVKDIAATDFSFAAILADGSLHVESLAKFSE